MNKVIYKIKKIPKPLLSSVIYMMIVFFQSGINLITTPIFSRLLNTQEFGVTTTYNSWFSILSILITLNLSSGVFNNALIDFYTERKKVMSSFFSIGIVNSILILVFYLFFKNTINSLIELPTILIIFMIVQCLLTSAWSFFLAKEKFDYKFLKPLIFTFIIFILNPIFGYAGIIIFPKYKAIAKIIGCNVPSFIVYFILMIYIIFKGKKIFDKRYWKYALSFNIPLLPHYLSGILLASSDRIMIQKMINFETAGIYGIAYQLSLVVQGVFTGINSALIPYTYKKMKVNDIYSLRKYANIMMYIVLGVCICVTLLGPEIIKVLAPYEYYSAMYVIPPIVLGLFYSFVASIFCNLEFYTKKTKFVTFATCLGAFINIFLNIVLIPKFGFIAAGYTTFIGYVIIMILHYCYLKKLQLLYIYDLKSIFLICITSFIVITCILFIYDFILLRIIIFILLFLLILISKNKIIDSIKQIKED